MIFVCLVSRQTMPNLLHILQAKPERVVCIATKQEDESRKVLQAALRTQKIACDPPLYVDAYDPETTLTACRQIIERYGRSQLMANLTGGTKVMSLAAFRAFSAAKVRCLYTDTQNQRLLSLYPDKKDPEPLDTHIDVQLARGCRCRLWPRLFWKNYFSEPAVNPTDLSVGYKAFDP